MIINPLESIQEEFGYYAILTTGKVAVARFMHCEVCKIYMDRPLYGQADIVLAAEELFKEVTVIGAQCPECQGKVVLVP